MRLACCVTRSSSRLLLGLGLLVAADLIVLGGIAAAATAVDGRQLRFQPRAHRIDRRRAYERRRGRHPALIHLRKGAGTQRKAAERARRRPGMVGSKIVGRGAVGVFGISGQFRGFRPRAFFAAGRRSAPPIAASCGSVTSFPGHRCGTESSRVPARLSALAGDGDIFVATATRAVRAGFRHRPGDFIRIDAAIGRGLGKIA